MRAVKNRSGVTGRWSSGVGRACHWHRYEAEGELLAYHRDCYGFLRRNGKLCVRPAMAVGGNPLSTWQRNFLNRAALAGSGGNFPSTEFEARCPLRTSSLCVWKGKKTNK